MRLGREVYKEVRDRLSASPRVWLVTGAAGFIGSNLIEVLLALDQTVVGIDNFSTGSRRNLDEVRAEVGERRWRRFTFLEGDVCDLDTCRRACDGVTFVLHQAALGSVPRSLENPIATNRANVDGFLNMLVAALDAGVTRFVYAASSSTYGDHPGLPKVEDTIGRPLSPYAVSKYVNELYASVFERAYGLKAVGLRYFNVFGRRQDPDGAYAAVIPRWIRNMLAGEACVIHGDGETTRDFTYVENVVQANLLAATAVLSDGDGAVYNVSCGEGTSLNELFQILRTEIESQAPQVEVAAPVFRPSRPGDIRHSVGAIAKARRDLGYLPSHSLRAGLSVAMNWYVSRLRSHAASEQRADGPGVTAPAR